MADTCTCPPASNIYCSAFSTLFLSAIQPTCQLIPSGDRVDNPYYDVISNTSYFTYGIELGCNSSFGNIQDFLILVCENIPLENVIRVDELLDGCPEFTSVSFDFNNTGGQTPPPGFKYLRIIVNEDIQPGACGVYRIALAGNYPSEIFNPTQSNGFVIIGEGGLAGFSTGTSGNQAIYPGCPAIPRLTVTKDCKTVITNNQATILYSVIVSNTGNADISEVFFTDSINFNGTNINIGDINVSPDTLSIDTTTQGVIRISGNLGPLNAGDSISISYSIAIAGFNAPGTYTFNNLAIAQSNEVQGSAQCTTTIDAVALTTGNCCIVDQQGNASFRISVANVLNSPATSIALGDVLTIPENLVVQFTSFDTCAAVFVDTGLPVPLNTDITNRQIALTCLAEIPQDATMNYNINFTIQMLNSFLVDPLIITNILDIITLQNPDEQVLINVSPLPNETQIDVSGIVECTASTSERS